MELVYLSHVNEMLAARQHELEDGGHQPVDQLLDQVELFRDELLTEVRIVWGKVGAPTWNKLMYKHRCAILHVAL